MADIRFNAAYLQSDRGFAKIAQIILGIFICAALCGQWYGGTACFGEGREGYVSGLNFVVLIVNVVLLIMNLCNIFVGQAEYAIDVVCAILYVIAVALFLWFLIQTGLWGTWNCLTLVALIVLLFLFAWDSGRARHRSDHLPI